MPQISSIERQLFANQLWETVAFVAKAAFMLGLTPWMIRVWGTRGYGEFALASSAVVLISILDLGIRARTRLVLCHALATSFPKDRDLLGESVATLGSVAIVATLTVCLLTRVGLFDRAFKISPANHYLLLTTVALAMLVLVSGLFIEPLVALGKMGRTKLATALGWILAIPGVALVLHRQGTVTLAVSVWLLSLLGANLIAIVVSGRELHRFYPAWSGFSLRAFRAVVREGFWFNASNTSWLAKTYGATFLLAAIDGPMIAGFFFILLRLSEIISALGAVSSDVSLADIARATQVAERRASFASSYSWSVLICSHSALVICFFTSDFLRRWLGAGAPDSRFAGLVAITLGLGSALNRTTTFAAMPLGVGRSAARWGLIEALAFISLLSLLPQSLGLIPKLALACLSSLAIFPAAAAVSQRLGASATKVWIRPFGQVMPFIALSASLLALSALGSLLVYKLIALFLCGMIGLLNLYFWQTGRNFLPWKMARTPTELTQSGEDISGHFGVTLP